MRKGKLRNNIPEIRSGTPFSTKKNSNRVNIMQLEIPPQKSIFAPYFLPVGIAGHGPN
jgi:hypothetical protein